METDRLHKLRTPLLLGVGIVLGTLVASLDVPSVRAQEAAISAPSATVGGRYQIIFNPNGIRADTFLLDTQTGRMWRPTSFTDLAGEPRAWVYEDRVDNSEELRAWAAQFRSNGN